MYGKGDTSTVTYNLPCKNEPRGKDKRQAGRDRDIYIETVLNKTEREREMWKEECGVEWNCTVLYNFCNSVAVPFTLS